MLLPSKYIHPTDESKLLAKENDLALLEVMPLMGSCILNGIHMPV